MLDGGIAFAVLVAVLAMLSIVADRQGGLPLGLVLLGVIILGALGAAGWGVGELVLVRAGVVVLPPGRASERGWLFFSKIMLGVWIILGASIFLSAAIHLVSYLAWYFTRN